MGLTWEEAEVAALNRQEWCRSVAQYVHVDVGWIKSSQVKGSDRVLEKCLGVLESPGKVPEFFVSKRVGTLGLPIKRLWVQLQATPLPSNHFGKVVHPCVTKQYNMVLAKESGTYWVGFWNASAF